MSFTEAIRSVLNQYAGFTGRARRSEYWYWTLFYIILSVIASMLDRAIFDGTYASCIQRHRRSRPADPVTRRRGASPARHDRSGWWILLGLIPVVGGIILLIFYIQDSHGDNQYGPSPKAVGSAPGSAPGPAPTPA